MLPIAQVFSGVSALTAVLNPFKPGAVEPAAAPTPPPAPRRELSESSAAALRRVAARYDVTDITPRQFSMMLDELHKTGALSETELNQLAQVLLDVDADGTRLDEHLDLVKFYTDRLDKLQDNLDDQGADEAAFQAIAPSLSAIQKRLDWISRLAVLHSVPDGAGVDVLT